VTIGGAVLSGTCGRVVRREDGYYLEPAADGAPPINLPGGEVARVPIRLNPGDTFRVGDFSYTLTG